MSAAQDVKERSLVLTEKFDFDLGATKKIWCFGPHGKGPNLLVDGSTAVDYLQDVRDTVVAGFQWATEEVRGDKY